MRAIYESVFFYTFADVCLFPSYDDTLDQVTSYLKVNLEDLVKIEIG